ncbi:extracellular solute-binding protein [Pendulispora albinea]|uniref:Extracellular solute-binding protein n=1 Tax=Pendulispora albinea TaxID=2741071 RepID=A0ABZ2M7Z0_9BACT
MRERVEVAWVLAATMGLSAGLLAGCRGSSSSSSSSGSGSGSGSSNHEGAGAQEKPVTITWWDTSDSTNEAPKFKDLIVKFQSKYPNIKVDYQNIAFDQARDKFKTAAQASTAPDVMRAEVAWTAEFASLRYLAPLEGTAASADLGDYLPAPLSSNKYDGKLYGVPQVTDALALLYNKALLQKAGVSEPPATMEQLKQTALAVKAKAGADGLYLNPQGYFLLPFIYGAGGDLVRVEQKKIVVNGAEAVKGLEVALDLIKSGAAPKPDLNSGYNQMQAGFKDGKVAMVLNGPWSVADDFTGKAFADKANLGIAPVPAGSSGKPGAPLGGHNYVVYAGSKNLPASYQFVQFMNSAENQAYLAKELGLLPTRASAYQLPDASANPVVPKFKAVIDKAVPRPAIAQGGQLLVPLDQNYARAIGGDKSPQAALDSVASDYRQFLKDWN